jgi:hypothetical protein
VNDPDRDPSTRIDTDLRRRLDAHPDQLQSVSVRFTELPPAEELSAAGLAATGVNPAMGMVDRASAYALAARPDVVRITLQPEPDLY